MKSAKEGNDAFMKSRPKQNIAKELPGSHEVKVKSSQVALLRPTEAKQLILRNAPS